MLTKEILCAYAPYKPKMQTEDGILDLNGVYTMEYGINIFLCLESSSRVIIGRELKNEKLLLRPLSSLTKPITHNGETFVPIERLFTDYVCKAPYILIGFNEGDKSAHVKISLDKAMNALYIFFFNHKDMCFGHVSLTSGAHRRLPFQFQMFQKLHEWKFDLYSLLESGHAIELKEVDNGK